MSSPWRRADTSSPSTRAVGEGGRRRRSGHAQHSPYKQKSGSSSTEVWDEFSRLYIDGERTSQKNLDEQIAGQERRHNEALAAAAAEHERVREAAERAREKVELEMERERKRREEEDIRALEAEQRAKEDREAAERRRLKEHLEQQEAQRKRAAEEKDIETTRARLAEQKRRDETDAARRKQEEEDADRRARGRENAAKAARTAAAAAAAASATPAPAPAQSTLPPSQNAPTEPASSQQAQQAQGPSQSAPGTFPPQAAQSNLAKASATSSLAEREALHVRYLDLHKRMKAMREYVVVEGKKNPALKERLGKWRRALNTAMGQMTTEKGGHRGTLQQIVTILKEAQQFPEPSVDVSSYLISVAGTGSPIPISGPFIYLLNIFSKAVLQQLIHERAKIAEPIMVTAVSIFANNAFQANGSICLIDMLLAKYHVACPVLWGIYGNEKTAKGRARIGWNNDKGTWIDEQGHIERMMGLGAGYAALSLRDFSKSRMQNPYPPVNYWKTMSYIVNTPASEIQPTHFIVLKALIDGHIHRFVGFYGQAALVALRKALVEFPAQAQKGPARDSVMVMPETIRKDMMLTL
ncbi:hypothetical protein BDV97DRAFT_342547 [Delphinella strobiligena]|nr:hypothetical protein BDV97DRAFT_342547 [Delphinella strobiligena]